MSLDRIGLSLIAPHVNGAAILALGYPDMAVSDEDFRALVGFDKKGAKNTHGLLATAGAVAFDVVDVIAHKGMERIVDLNEPQAWPRRYELVINPGTLEHCFNIGLAWANAWAAVAPGGHLLQVCPASMLNHGFWNVCPVALEEWCRANGGRVRELRFARNGTLEKVLPGPASQWLPGAKTGRGALPPETVMYGLLQKLVELPHKWPAQGIYRSDSPAGKAAA